MVPLNPFVFPKSRKTNLAFYKKLGRFQSKHFVWDFFFRSYPRTVSSFGISLIGSYPQTLSSQAMSVFAKHLSSMCINPITHPSRQDDLFPGTNQSVASIDVFIVFLVDVSENKKGVLRCATTTWTGLRSLARRMGSLLDFTPCSPLSTC